MSNMTRDRRYGRTILLLALALVAALALAACGGGNDDNAPLVEGARRIDSGDVGDADAENLGYKVTDARLGVWKSDQGFEAVADFYQNGIKDQGWNVELAVPYGDGDMIVFLTKEQTLAIVDVMSGSSAKGQLDLFTESNLDFSENSADDSDAVILLTHFTCAETDMQTCIQGAEGL